MKKQVKVIIALVVLGVLGFNVVRHMMKKDEALRGRLYVSGVIEATEVNLSFQVGGKVEALFADEGVFVKKGDLLASLDKEELLLMKKQAEAAYKEAKLSYKRLKKDYERAKELYSAGAITKQQMDAAETAFKVAEAKTKRLKATLDLVNLKLSYADLLAPMDGFIITKSAEQGEVVSPASTIFTLLDLKNVWLTAYINETDLGKVKLGQDVSVKTDTYPNKSYKGKLSFISQEAEFTPKYIQTKEERTKLVYRIKVNLDNSNLELKPGMPADAYIDIE